MSLSKRMAWQLGFVFGLAIIVWAAPTHASSVRQPEAASPSDQVLAPAAESSTVVEEGSTICTDRCIRYRHHPTLRRTCRGCGTMEVVLAVPDCCRCCTVNVPVCIPCCCTDTPKVCQGRGLFGRCVVTYEWCCGYKVQVAFDRCGDLIVHSFGRF